MPRSKVPGRPARAGSDAPPRPSPSQGAAASSPSAAAAPDTSVKAQTGSGNGSLLPNGVTGWANQMRLPLSWGLQTMMLMLHAGEEWQRAQLDSWHLALRHHEQAHARLLHCEDAAEMASLHADLLRFDAANVTHLSQRCMDTGVHLNTNLARLVAQTLDGSRSQWMRSALDSMQSGIRTGIGPLDEIFNAPLLRELALRPAGEKRGPAQNAA